MITSLPAPPLRIGWTLSLARPVASIVSAPSRASIASFSPRSGLTTLTVAGRPLIVCVVPFVVALIESAPWVPIAVTVSTRRSAVERVTSTFVVAVPLRSRTVTLSVPPSGSTLTVSMPPVSAEPVNPYSTRVRASNPWTSIDSSAALPVAESVSAPAPPSTRSMPSAGPREKRSSPSPRSTVSSPLPPVTTSPSGPPISVSAASVPSSTSWPGPPSNVSATGPPGR